VLTIGKFDGIHRGHRHVLEEVTARARARDWQSAVIILWPPPPEVLRPGARIPRLSTLADRESAIAATGIDLFILWPFTHELSRLSPRDFMQVLRDRLDLRVLVIGSDFALGHQRSGTPDVLRELGGELGFEVVVSPPHVYEGQVVSSSQIREHLATGDVSEAARLLGRWPTLTGTVVRGEGRGRVLGFPTANLHLAEPLAVPGHGIYATLATIGPQGGDFPHSAVTSIGVRPTFGDENEQTVETYLLDFSDDLYDQVLRVHFVEKLRDELKFASVDDLVDQMERDVTHAAAVLGQHT
jgi:riboflavin kinase/FMN adenylyltransferase